MTRQMELSPEALEILSFATGRIIERDPETERLRLRHEGVEYVAALDGAA